jgi:hypothetical protein
MSLKTNKRLFDIATRMQLFTQGIKNGFITEFNVMLKELEKEIIYILAKSKYETLDGLTKAELKKLLLNLKSAQLTVYSKYLNKFIKQLEVFMEIDLKVNRQIYASVHKEIATGQPEILTNVESIKYIKKENDKTNCTALLGLAAILGNVDRLKSFIYNSPIPANGILPLTYLKTLLANNYIKIENLIRKGYVNNWSVKQTINEIIDESPQGVSSQLHKVKYQGKAVISTMIQDVTQTIESAVASALFLYYIWCSIMDNRTSAICRRLNRQKFRFGQGPLPPAHDHCRSHISPIVGTDFVVIPFSKWITTQPASYRKNMKYENGILTFDEFESIVDTVLE